MINMTNHFDDFISRISPLFVLEGFKFIKSKKSFINKSPLGENIFEIESLSNGIEIIPSFGVKIHILERILLHDVYGLSIYSSSIPTIYWRGGHLIEDYNNIRLFIISEQEKKVAEKQIFNFYKNYAQPSFNKYSSIREIDLLLNDINDTYDTRLHSTEWNTSQYLGLITAKLLNRIDYKEIEVRNLDKIERLHRDKIPENMERFNRINFEEYREQLRLLENTK